MVMQHIVEYSTQYYDFVCPIALIISVKMADHITGPCHSSIILGQLPGSLLSWSVSAGSSRVLGLYRLSQHSCQPTGKLLTNRSTLLAALDLCCSNSVPAQIPYPAENRGPF